MMGTFSPGPNVNISADGTLDLNNTDQNIKGLKGLDSSNIKLSIGNLTINLAEGEKTFCGVISGDGSLIKEGNGTLMFNIHNILDGGTSIFYKGDAIIKTGTLQIKWRSNEKPPGHYKSFIRHSPIKIEDGVNLIFDIKSSRGNYSIDYDLYDGSPISGQGGLTKKGDGDIWFFHNGNLKDSHGEILVEDGYSERYREENGVQSRKHYDYIFAGLGGGNNARIEIGQESVTHTVPSTATLLAAPIRSVPTAPALRKTVP